MALRQLAGSFRQAVPPASRLLSEVLTEPKPYLQQFSRTVRHGLRCTCILLCLREFPGFLVLAADWWQPCQQGGA